MKLDQELKKGPTGEGENGVEQAVLGNIGATPGGTYILYSAYAANVY